MERTFHGRALIRIVENKCEENPTLARDLMRLKKKLQGGAYDPKLIDFVTQKHWSSLSLEDAYAFAVVWHWYNTGQFWFCSIPVGSPYSDACLNENKEMLSKLPEGFRSALWCGTQECDGRLHWDFDIGLTSFAESADGKCPCGCGRHEYKEIHRFFPASSAPLEVGTTQSSRSLLHLQQERALARWPYGSNDILLGILTAPVESVL